ncbi:MAG: hypothetical protein AABZ53_08500 [Planctomycetota bacterium]
MTDHVPGENEHPVMVMGVVAAKVPWIVWIGVGTAIVLDVAVQMAWKQCVAGVPDSAGFAATLTHAATKPLSVALAILMATQIFNWSWLLSRADLSFVQPLTALSYPITAGLAWAAFDEQIGALRAGGLVLVLAGVWLIGGTAASTTRGAHA